MQSNVSRNGRIEVHAIPAPRVSRKVNAIVIGELQKQRLTFLSHFFLSF